MESEHRPVASRSVDNTRLRSSRRCDMPLLATHPLTAHISGRISTTRAVTNPVLTGARRPGPLYPASRTFYGDTERLAGTPRDEKRREATQGDPGSDLRAIIETDLARYVAAVRHAHKPSSGSRPGTDKPGGDGRPGRWWEGGEVCADVRPVVGGRGGVC